MDFLGIGPLEIMFVLLIALIIFGPKDIVKAGQSAGRFLRKMMTSPGWKVVQETSRDLRNLPNKLVREAGLEEIKKDVDDFATIAKPPDFKKEIQTELDKVGEGLSAWTSPAIDKTQTDTQEETPTSPETPLEQTEN